MNNAFKNKCRLSIGDSFVYKGDYCRVIGMRHDFFIYSIQGKPNTKGFMTYQFYLTTPSAMGRKLQYKIENVLYK